MCPPDHFTVDYVINPWMAGNEDSLKLGRAKEQWQRLRDTVAEFADVVTIDAVPDLPDMVFTANAGVVYGEKAIASAVLRGYRRFQLKAQSASWRTDHSTCNPLLPIAINVGVH